MVFQVQSLESLRIMAAEVAVVAYFRLALDWVEVGNGGQGAATSGAINSGSGGGGTNFSGPPGFGGSGVVFVRYPGAPLYTGGIITTVGGDTVHQFTASGTLTPL